MNFHEMINNGGFGVSGPIQNYYSTNMVPFGSEGYCNQQLGYGVNMPQQQYVFAPVQQYQQQNMYYNSYTPQQQYQQSAFGGDYYNPYGQQMPTQQYQQQQYYYGGSYSYPGGYVTPMQQMQRTNKLKEIDKVKYRIVAGFKGKKIDEAKLDQELEVKYNPNVNIVRKSDEEIQNDSDWNLVCNLYHRSVTGNYAIPMREKSVMINLMMKDIQDKLGNHSMFEFFQKDLPMIKYDKWIGDNINLRGNRDLRSAYNSDEYNQLLSLHSNNNNPFISSLLDDSKYDNVYEDEMGMKVSIDKETNRLKILRDKLPTFVSSEETQKRRREWTNAILAQIYNKENSC